MNINKKKWNCLYCKEQFNKPHVFVNIHMYEGCPQCGSKNIKLNKS